MPYIKVHFLMQMRESVMAYWILEHSKARTSLQILFLLQDKNALIRNFSGHCIKKGM